MGRIVKLLIALCACVWAQAVSAEVTVSFHSFNGSVLFGRYPHTFVVLNGTLEDGTEINENYGFTAKRATPAVLRGPVIHAMLIEKPKYIRKTNRHFTIDITDQQYREIVAEMVRWRDAPGKYYDLDTRNCIHFVGTIAQMVGVTVEYPDNMLRRPKKWLNHITSLNPQLGAELIK